MKATKEISNTDDIIDIRDVIERFEELDDNPTEENREERESLDKLLTECRGNGGDHQWLGDWYPVTLIRESYFKDYAEELAQDIGAIDKNAKWPLQHIDWEAAAEELKMDYTAADFDGVTYFIR